MDSIPREGTGCTPARGCERAGKAGRAQELQILKLAAAWCSRSGLLASGQKRLFEQVVEL